MNVIAFMLKTLQAQFVPALLADAILKTGDFGSL